MSESSRRKKLGTDKVNFLKQDYDKAINNDFIEIRETGYGKGIFALKNFSSGESCCVFKGRIVVDRIVKSDYNLRLDDAGKICVPTISEKGGHLINHSCSPNTTWLGTESIETDDTFAAIVKATRPIMNGDQLTVYYGWCDDHHPTICLCGEKNCFGTIGLNIGRAKVDIEYVKEFLLNSEANKNFAAINFLITCHPTETDRNLLMNFIVKTLGYDSFIYRTMYDIAKKKKAP